MQPLFTQGNREQGYYIQDKWTPTRKLVINAGVRFESNYGWQDATCQPVTVFFTTGTCFDAIKGAPDLKNVLPRFAIVYDLNGDGRTAIKFAANRYDQPIQMEFVGRLNPVGATSDQRQWLPQSRCNEAGVRGCDRNGDLIPQISELGPSSGFALGSTARYADDLKYPVSNEYNFEVQRQLPGNMVLSVGYTHRQTRRNLGQRNVAVPENTYMPINVTDPVSGRAVTVHNQSPALAGRNQIVWDNEEILDGNYNGGDITVNKRMSNGWSLMAGASYGKSIGEVVGGDLNNPNSKEYRRGLLGNDVPWSYRLSGIYDLPYRIASMSGTLQYYTGVPGIDHRADWRGRGSWWAHAGHADRRRPAQGRCASSERVFARHQLEEACARRKQVVRTQARPLQPDKRIDRDQLADAARRDLSPREHDPGRADDQGGLQLRVLNEIHLQEMRRLGVLF